MTYEQLSPERRPEADRIRKIVMDAERGLGKAAMSDVAGSTLTNETEQRADTTEFETIPQAS